MSSSLAAGLDEVTGAEFAAVSPRPGAAPGDIDVAEHHGVSAFGVDDYRGVLDLQVQMRLAGMTVVTDRGQWLTAPHPSPTWTVTLPCMRWAIRTYRPAPISITTLLARSLLVPGGLPY